MRRSCDIRAVNIIDHRSIDRSIDRLKDAPFYLVGLVSRLHRQS